MEEDKEQNDVVDEQSTYEAYPAHERVKAEILNRLTSINENLCGFQLYSTYRDAKYKKKLNGEGKQSLQYWRQFQVSMLSLYGFLKPHIKHSKKAAKYVPLEELDIAFVNLVGSDKKIPPAKWIEHYKLLTEFVYELGVTKIELDKRGTDDIF